MSADVDAAWDALERELDRAPETVQTLCRVHRPLIEAAIRAEARAAALDEARGAVLRVLSGGSQTWAGFPLADAVLAAIDALREGADKV